MFDSVFDIWNYTYSIMMVYPMLSFLLNFKKEGVWNTERWKLVLTKPGESDFEHKEVGESSSQEEKGAKKVVSKLRIEPECYRLPI